MNHHSSLTTSKVFYLLLLIPAFYSCNLFVADKTTPIKVRIKKGVPATNELKLRDWFGFSLYTVDADPGTPIQWIQKADEVSEITRIYEKTVTPGTFSVPPHKITGTEDWEAVMSDAALDKIIEYNIEWRDKKGYLHPYDPKIAVKPVTFDFSRLALILLGLIAISIPTVRFMRRKNIKN